MTKPRNAVYAALVLAAITPALASCGDEIRKSDFWGGTGSSGVSGTVYDRNTAAQIHRLYIRNAAGTKYSLRVRLRPYRRCHDGDHYPACAEGGGR